MLKPSLQLKLGQQLTMTPQLQQAIRLLQLSQIELEAELAMLAAEVYRRPARVTVDVITGRERYTDRFASRNQVELPVQTQPAVGDASGRVR